MAKFLDKAGLEYVWSKLKTMLAAKADKTELHSHTNKALLDTYTQTETNLSDAVSKKHSHSNQSVLDGITSSKVSAWDAAEKNQNAFGKVTVGTTTIEADATTDTLTFAAGDNVTITADATGDKVTISATDTTYEAAGTDLGLVKSGGDVTIANGVITVNDDSHNHTIANVDGLETALAGKETSGAAASALADAKSYTDGKISDLINSAPTTLDTLGEIATAMSENAAVVEALEAAIGNKVDKTEFEDHTHNYAGSSSAGGAANSANKLNTDAGSATQPVYFANGIPVKTTHTLGATVPADAKFTDTVYTHPNSGVSAGTYRSVTVNAAGHVTAGTNPTTLAGYGITDAVAASDSITNDEIDDIFV